MLGLDRGAVEREASDVGRRPWRVPDEPRRAGLLPDIALNAGKARYVAGDAPLPSGPYTRLRADDAMAGGAFGRRGMDDEFDSLGALRLRQGEAMQAPRVPAIRAGALGVGGGGGGGAARRTDWAAKYGGRG